MREALEESRRRERERLAKEEAAKRAAAEKEAKKSEPVIPKKIESTLPASRHRVSFF